MEFILIFTKIAQLLNTKPMKNMKFLLAITLFFGITVMNAQKKMQTQTKTQVQLQTPADKWPHLKAFHTLLNNTLQYAEKGNTTPIKKSAEKLVLLANDLNIDNMPSTLKSQNLIDAIEQLKNQTLIVREAVDGNLNDKEILTALREVNVKYTSVATECNVKK